MTAAPSAEHAETADETGPDFPPTAVRVTVDQIVAMNIRRWRLAAGLTQEAFGDLIGWSAANVSAAERSAAHDKERRRFDGQTLAEISLALGVPLIALFLPPEDDGIDYRYFFWVQGRHEGRGYDMQEMMTSVVMPDSEDDSEVMGVYRLRLTRAVTRYLDPSWAKDVARWLGEVEGPEIRAERAEWLKGRRVLLLELAKEVGQLADAITADGGSDD